MVSTSGTTTLIILPFLIAVPVTIILTAILVYTYTAQRERIASTTTVCIITLTFLLATLFLLPIDVALTSRANNAKLGARKDWASDGSYIYNVEKGLKILYAVIYSFDVVLAGVVVPWAYFWYEESLVDEDDEVEGRTAGAKFWGALKYTLFFVVIVVGIFIAGLFVPVAYQKGKSGDWKEIIRANRGERAVTFAVGVMVTIGTVVFVLYTGAGLGLLPVRMIKSAPAVSMASLGATTASQLEANRERQRQLESRNGLDSRDRRELEGLVREERTLVRREQLVAESTRGEDAKNWGWLVKTWHKVEAAFRPLKLIGGLLLVVITLLLWTSMLITMIDKILNSTCKSQCGFLLGHVNIFQPVNWVLVKTSTVYPVDFVMYVLLVLLLFSASITGIATVGIRFLWITLFKIRRGKTSPQAMLLATMLLTLVVFAINFAMITEIAPGYATWGAQTYCSLPSSSLDTLAADCTYHPDAIRPCSESADNASAKSACVPSVMSGIIYQFSANWSALGLFCFWAQFAFLGIYMVVFVTTLFRTPKLDMSELDADLEEEEEEGLLASTGRRFNATWQDITGRTSKNYGAIPSRDEGSSS